MGKWGLRFSIGVLLTTRFASAAPPPLTLPLTTKAIEAYFSANPNSGVEQFLRDLPTSYTDSFVLLHRSHSLQRASYEKPRLVFFGPDARFLLGVGNEKDDPRYAMLEFAEFEPKQGTYRYGEIDLRNAGNPRVLGEVKMCANCHGTPARPIWGQYPKWKGAYSDEAGKISPEDRAGYEKFLKTAVSDSRFSFLRFSAGTDKSSFLLSGRYYAFANTDLNHELGNTVALGTLTRFRQSKNYETDRWGVLATSDAFHCIATDAWFTISPKIQRKYAAAPIAGFSPTSLLFVKAFRLLGVDPDLELSLEEMVPGLFDPKYPRTYGKWQTGAFRLDEAIAFGLLAEIMAEDAKLAEFFEGQVETIKRLALWAKLSGESRAEALRKLRGHYNYFDIFDPIIKSKKNHEAFCAYVASRL